MLDGNNETERMYSRVCRSLLLSTLTHAYMHTLTELVIDVTGMVES